MKKRTKRKRQKKTVLEIVDNHDLPVGAMDEDQIHTLQLLHRRVVVWVYNKEGKIYLVKEKTGEKTWRPPVCAHVLMGKSREEVALERLKKDMNLVPRKLHFLVHPPRLFGRFSELISVYGAHIPPHYKEEEEYLPIEKIALFPQDLKIIIEKYPSLLSPYTIMCWEEGIFSLVTERLASLDSRPNINSSLSSLSHL